MLVPFTKRLAAFEINPISKTVSVNDANIELHCQKASNLDFSIWEVFLNNGTRWTVTGADIEIHLSRLVVAIARHSTMHHQL